MMAVSFARDIKPLFTDMDVAHMKDLGVALDDYGSCAIQPRRGRSWTRSGPG